MIGFEMFLIGLLLISTFTGLTTEAVKKILTEFNIKYYANTLAGIIALIVSVGTGVSYIMFNGLGFTTPNIIYLIALVFMSWLCAMVGYDKVIQSINQMKKVGNE